MRIGIDYTAAAWQGAGIGRYTRELVRALVEQAADRRFVLFYAARGLPQQSPFLRELAELQRRQRHVLVRPIALTPQTLTRLWQRLRLPLPIEFFTGTLDVLHAPDFVAPPTRAPRLITVHDLSFLARPECAEPRLRRYLQRAMRRQVAQASLIVAVSQATRQDLISWMGVAPERIRMIYSGVSAQFRPLAQAELAGVGQRLGLPAQFLLHVGTLEPRKNLVRLIEAHAQVPEAPDLVLAGRRGWLYTPILEAAQRAAGRVQILDYVDDADLPAVYNLARAVVYPSLYEGFGFPALEALACATPLITSQGSSLPEVAGAAALLVNPEDRAAISAAMRRLLSDRVLEQQLRAAGPVQAARFDWRSTATQILACYDSVAA